MTIQAMKTILAIDDKDSLGKLKDKQPKNLKKNQSDSSSYF